MPYFIDKNVIGFNVVKNVLKNEEKHIGNTRKVEVENSVQEYIKDFKNDFKKMYGNVQNEFHYLKTDIVVDFQKLRKV